MGWLFLLIFDFSSVKATGLHFDKHGFKSMEGLKVCNGCSLAASRSLFASSRRFFDLSSTMLLALTRDSYFPVLPMKVYKIASSKCCTYTYA